MSEFDTSENIARITYHTGIIPVIIRPHRSTRLRMWVRPIVTDRVAWFIGLSVCLSVTVMNFAKPAELIEMPFGLWTPMGPRNHVLDGGPDHPMRRDNFEGNGRPIV